jgi:hypothetical protein
VALPKGPIETPESRESAAAELGRKGGKARAAKLPKRKRTEIANKGAAARWSKRPH